MKSAARNLEFEKAALLRDRIMELRKELVEFQQIDSGNEQNHRPHPVKEGKNKESVKSHHKVVK